MRRASDAIRQRWFVAGLLILFAALSVQYTYKVRTHETAIVRWLDQLKKWDDGEDIFAREDSLENFLLSRAKTDEAKNPLQRLFRFAD